jgi:hypothetical protein
LRSAAACVKGEEEEEGGGGKRNKTRYEMKKLKDKNLEIKQCKSLR